MSDSFTCPVCRRTSWNPNDVRHGYCGFCHDYTGTGEGQERALTMMVQRWDELADFCQETDRLARELWRFVFLPWRWGEWRRRAKVVRERLAIQTKRIEEVREWTTSSTC